MNQFTLKTKWVALAFAVMTLFTAYIVAGSQVDESGSETAASPGDAAPAGQASAEVPPAQTPDAADQPEFVDDDALIDDASGEDPSQNGDFDSADNGDNGGDGGDDDFGPVQNPSVVSQGKAPDGTPIVIQK